MEKLLSLAGKVKDEAKEIGVSFTKVADILNEKIKKQHESPTL